jgi:hypothetical protein
LRDQMSLPIMVGGRRDFGDRVGIRIGVVKELRCTFGVFILGLG